MENSPRRIFTFTSKTIEEFEAKARQAKSLGATHITISQIEKSRWQWERDLSDPYPNWGMLVTSLFKIIVPDELKQWLPLEYAKRNLELIKGRSRILNILGLKGSFHMKEPAYLPEEVYRVHPEWRGPRCDHPRRAVNHYFSPCIDREDILEMYEKAMYELCKNADIEYFHIFTNDSGGGLCWSSGLYTGKNGPEWCKNIPMSKRIGKFLNTLKTGATRAGVDSWIEINSNIGIKEPEYEMDAMWPSLPDNQAVNKRSNTGNPLAAELFLNWEYTIQPVINIAKPFEFLTQYEKACSSGLPAQLLTIDDTDFNVYYRLMEKFNANPTKGIASRTALIKNVADEIAGKDSDDLMDIWDMTEQALLHFADTGLEGLVSCAINQRWINRPFVLFPDELPPEDKDYYRAFQFQANDEAHANDLLDIQNSSFIRGYSGVFIASMALNKTISLLTKAAAKASAIAGFEQYADRLRILACFMKNALHAIKFQHIVDRADYEREVEISPEWPLDAESDLLKFERITRAEIDNINDLIKLIEGRESDMILLAPTHELEDVFLLSPNICDQLKKKTHIMINHLLDGKRLFITNNK